MRDDQQPEDGRRSIQAGDVCGRQHPRQRDPGGRGGALPDLVPGRESRPGRIPSPPDRREGLLRRARRSTRTAGPTGSTRRTPPTVRGAARARSTTTATARPTRTATTTSTATARSPRCGGRTRTADFKISPEDPRLLVPIKPGEEVGETATSFWASRGSTTTATARSTRTRPAATT